jgi:hypothetical protein
MFQLRFTLEASVIATLIYNYQAPSRECIYDAFQVSTLLLAQTEVSQLQCNDE